MTTYHVDEAQRRKLTGLAKRLGATVHLTEGATALTAKNFKSERFEAIFHRQAGRFGATVVEPAVTVVPEPVMVPVSEAKEEKQPLPTPDVIEPPKDVIEPPSAAEVEATVAAENPEPVIEPPSAAEVEATIAADEVAAEETAADEAEVAAEEAAADEGEPKRDDEPTTRVTTKPATKKKAAAKKKAAKKKGGKKRKK